ncbi:hypothetical protein ABZS59_32800 [Streptomyces flaveolus]|jgi:hypothetical protein|uniref:hypothetical protein n=1 Tax=Streptomyces flaveolus TaxID=67297 RepID=UPI0033BD9D9F
MRRRTGAAGIAVAIAAIVPLADPAHPQELDSRTLTHQRAAQTVFDSGPGDQDPFAPGPFTPEPLSPDALSPDALGDGPSGEGRPDGSGADAGRPDAGGFDEYRPDQGSPDGGRLDQGGTGQGGFDPGSPDEGRLDQGGNGQGGFDPGSPDEGRLDQGGNGQGGNGRGGDGQGGNGIGRIDAAREAEGGAAGGVSPRRDSFPTVSATSKPRPVRTTPAPVTTAVPGPATSPAVTPTLGTRGGLGGASGTGPSGWDVGIGLGCVASAALASAYVLRRRRRA